MALFNEIKVDLIQGEDKNVLQRLSDFRETHIASNQTYWNEANKDALFEVGDPSVYLEYYNMPYPLNRNRFIINKIRKVVNLISGFQRTTRKSSIFSPIENADQLTADQFTKLIMWLNKKEGVLETVSDCFNNSLITGMSLLEVWMDFRDDPLSGNIKVDSCPMTSIMMDSFFRKKDLSDCNGLWKRSYLTLDEVRSFLDNRVDYDYDKLKNVEKSDYQFTYMPEATYANKANFFTYDEFYYRSKRKQKVMIDSVSGATVEIFHNNEEYIDDIMKLFPTAMIHDREIPTINVSIIVNNTVVFDGRNPTGLDSYPFVPVLGYFRPELSAYNGRIQGIVRTMRDPSYVYNRRKETEIDMLTTQLNTGHVYKPDSLVDKNDVNKTGQGKNIAIKSECSLDDIRQMQPVPIAPTTLEVSNSFERLVPDTIGANEELIGSAVDNKGAFLSMLRQRSGLVVQQSLFDDIDYAQSQLGSKIAKLMQLNFTPGKVKRILNEKPSDQFYNRNFGEYDCVVEDGFNTSTQKQLQFAQLMELKTEGGIDVPPSFLIESATLQNKQELIDAIEKQEQMMAQQAQQAQQGEQQEAQARLDMFESKAKLDVASSLEKQSKVIENFESANERKAEALKDREQAKLNLAKAAKEVEEIDLSQIEKLIALNRMLKADEVNNNQQTINKNLGIEKDSV